MLGYGKLDPEFGLKSDRRMKKINFPKVIFLILTFCFLSFKILLAIDWQQSGSEHFIVYHAGDGKFAKEILNKSEKYYLTIAKNLGYPRYSEFWLWDNRVKIYMYPDQGSFLKATGQPEWSEGMASYTDKFIASHVFSKEFIESVLPHEVAHLIFRDFVGFKGEIPLWLDEGVAQWSEEVKRVKMRKLAMQFYSEDKLLSIDDLMTLDVRRLKDIERVYIRAIRTRKGADGVLFLDANTLVSTYYLQSVSVVEFLIQRYGTDRFIHFCRQLRDGKSLEEAF